MPPPIKVELAPHSPSWGLVAREETLRLHQALGDTLVAVHHIGSTAIPGIHAKPIIDLMPVVRALSELDAQESALLRLGYQGWGEYGIAGRRYFTFEEPSTGRRVFQCHCFEAESFQIERHVAFRDYMRANPAKAHEYDQEKHRCRQLHPDDSHAYTDAKADWIAAQHADAVAHYRRTQ